MTTTNQTPRALAAERLHKRLQALLREAHDHRSPALAELAIFRKAAGRPISEATDAVGQVVKIIEPALYDDDGRRLPAWESDPIIDDVLLVASLVAFALPPVRGLFRADDDGEKHRVAGSFGRDLAALRRASPKAANGSGDSAVDRLIRTILDAEREDLDRLLRRAFSLMGRGSAGDPTAVHVAALVNHLGAWRAEDRWVQRRWAYDYWTTINRGDAAAKTTTGNDA